MAGPGPSTSTHELPLPNSTQKVKVEVELVPADRIHESLRNSTNITKVNIGGQEFFAVVGKTAVV